jgi:type IV pilus assembly protein PilE
MNPRAFQGRRQAPQAGFTLVELLIAVVISGVLVAIAVPSFSNYIMQGRRPDAKTGLLDLAAREERYYTVHNSYTAVASNLGYGSTASFPMNVGSGPDYQLAVTSPAGTTAGSAFTITATPINAQASDACGTYSLNNLGLQTVSGSPGASSCW